MKAVICAALLLLLSTAPASAAVPVQAPPAPDEALVYLYRTNVFAMAVRTAAFYVDGSALPDLGSGDCTVFRVPAGNHQIKQKWKKWLGDMGDLWQKIDIHQDWEGGQTYYYAFSTQSAVGGRGPGLSVELSWALDPVDAAVAAPALARCKFKPAAPINPHGPPTSPAA